MTKSEDGVSNEVRDAALEYAEIEGWDKRIPFVDGWNGALKSAPEEVREKIFGAMSERASEMLREDLQALGPQKVSDVEGAQRDVVAVVKRLEEEGKIVIGFSEENEVIP